MTNGRLLFIDAYDSFSNNIIALLHDHLPVTVTVIKIDDPRFVLNDDAILRLLNYFDAVVAGPGPGHPANADDIGLIGKLWRLPEEQQPPVLGVCLGFQSLCLAYGANVQRLRKPRHGLITAVTHCDRDIFDGSGDINATQYHSLHVKLDDCNVQNALWTPSRTTQELVPLAWDLSDTQNGPILMGARHCGKPLWGVQYHPESICTNTNGQLLISKWWRQACAWNTSHRRGRSEAIKTNGVVLHDGMVASSSPHNLQATALSANPKVQWTVLVLDDAIEVINIIEALQEPDEPILLESGTRDGRPLNRETGRFSIIGLQGDARRSAYSLEECEQRMQEFRAVDGPPTVPFWGGLLGYVSYEAGLKTIDVPLAAPTHQPQAWFVWAERSIVVDHVQRTVYIQSIAASDNAWILSTKQAISQLSIGHGRQTQNMDVYGKNSDVLSEPDKALYCRKVGDCQAHLQAGSSYELCLTDQTVVRCFTHPWTLYQKLRRANPAPFGAYLRLGTHGSPGANVISSSPERFLSWSRSGTCQFRPIKGTVKKTPGMTRVKAEEILGSAKERAENLMIVDLIRHDLNGVAR